MSEPPVPETDGVPPRVLAAIRAELRDDEELVWAGRPWLRTYFRHFVPIYPLCLIFGAAALGGAWVLYEWANGAGALRSFRILVSLALLAAFGVALVVLPPLWSVRLARSWYALTTRRVILRRPLFLVLWPRVLSLEAGAAAGGRVKVNLPDRSGDISWPPRGTDRRVPPGVEPRMEYVPRVEHVAELIERTLSRASGDATADAPPPADGGVPGPDRP